MVRWPFKKDTISEETLEKIRKSRRAFLKGSAYTIAGIGVAAPVINVASGIIWKNLPSGSLSLPVDDAGRDLNLYPYKNATIEKNDVKYTICGVDHTQNQAKKWRDVFEPLIRDADTVLLEATLEESKSCANDYCKFYNEMVEMCKDYGKIWFNAEPISTESEKYTEIGKVSDIIAPILAAEYFAVKSMKLTEDITNETEKSPEDIYKSRLSSMLLLGSSISTILSLGAHRVTWIAPEAIPIVIDQLDYRNVKLGKALNILPGVVPKKDKKNIVSIYGYQHAYAMAIYTKLDSLRLFKEKMYSNIFDEPDNKPLLKRYDIDPFNREYKETNSIPL